jgi:hypothetical protein
MKTNFLEFLSKIKTFGDEIVVVEENFNWKEYFSNPNVNAVPTYHNNEYALMKYEIKEISKNGLIVWLERESKMFYGLIPYKKFNGFVDDFGNGDLIALFEFNKESLFEKIWPIENKNN